MNEEALAHWGLLRQIKKIYITIITTTTTSFIWGGGTYYNTTVFVKVVAIISRFRTVAMFVTVK
jgi:hypothetical protein